MLPDPRVFPAAADASPALARCHALAAASLGAATGADADASDDAIAATLAEWLRAGDGDALAALLASSPSIDVRRHLGRMLARLAVARTDADSGLAVTLFAIPVVIVAAAQGEPDAHALLSGVLPDVRALDAILREQGALGGNRSVALANVLVGANALDAGRLPALLAAARLPANETGGAPLALAPAPLDIAGSGERAHLRFLMGTAIAAPGVDLLRDAAVGRWGQPLSQALSAQLAAAGVTLVALPRAAQSVVTAVQVGRAAQREISAQLFASNAIRRLRAGFGEPTAVISAHRVGETGGEVRLSLSTAFDPKEAEGFRCPLYAADRVGDVATSLIDLLHDCRVTDIRVVDGIHPDSDPTTGITLLFKPETIPATTPVTLH
jgi:hypothetical protein